jgi:hypothetical protein
MIFFTDKYFSETQKAELLGKGYLKKEDKRLHGTKVMEFRQDVTRQDTARKANPFDFVFMGSVVALYVAVALLNLLANTHPAA